ncbi:MAG: radical SAM protein [Candidatus Omnitrophica bacterium]|nr:radical SAM protein [Candidatus Omnitrophota bacterium]
MLELVKALENNNPLGTVQGLIYRNKSDVVKNSPRTLIADLDQLPWPLREGLPVKRYNDAPGDIPIPCASMWASRGCPFGCSFCLWPQVMYGGNSYRVRSVKNVVDEMEYLIKELGFKSVYFDDDTWNIGSERIIAFCDELEQRKLNVPWAIMARAELMNEYLLERMRKAGLYAVKYGIESSSQKIVNDTGKRLNLEKAEEMIRYTKYLGIKTHLTFTFGLPGETQQTINETIEYACRLNPTSVQFSLATPFPGTRFYDEMEKKGYIVSKDLEKLDGNHSSVIRTQSLSARELQQAKKKAYITWNRHCRFKRQRLKFPQKTIKEKFDASLLEYGLFYTTMKILRYILRRLLIIPWKIRSFFNANLWIIEEIITAGNISIKFGEGQVRVYYNNIEISKGIGITASFYYGERWFDSSRANWKLEKDSEKSIRVKLTWDDIPIRQSWTILIGEEGKISWNSKLQVQTAVQLLEYKAGIMLQEQYTRWKDELGVGNFPKITQWEEIELYNANSRRLFVFKEAAESNSQMPEVELALKTANRPNIYPQIQNTDIKTNARIIQMRSLRIEQFVPGEYAYFDLEIFLHKKNLIAQNVSALKKRTPLGIIKAQIAQNGASTVLRKIIKNLHPVKLSDYYTDIVGVMDGSYAYKGPYCVQIDLTNDCNNDCVGCWCNSPLLKERKISKEIKQQALPLDVVKKTIDDLALMGTKEIYFAGGGEPFMHAHIMEILEYVKAKGLKCYINTNFTLVTENMVKRLVEIGVDHLVVSVWAGTAQTYKLTHPNKSEEMFYQIKGMLKLLNSLKDNVPQVNVYNIIFNRNFKELPQMVDFALEAGADSLEFTVIDTIPEATDTLILDEGQRLQVCGDCENIQKRLEGELKGKIKILQFEQFLRRVNNNAAQKAEYDDNILAEIPCYIGWIFARILADGNVNFCLKAHRIPVGNIYAHSFSQIWNNRKQQEFRIRALCQEKTDPFFSFIGNDPNVQVGCFKGCDDLARNIRMHEKIQSLTRPEFIFLRIVLILKKMLRLYRTKALSSTFKKRLQTTKRKPILSSGKLSIDCCEDGIKLYWDGKELTESVGLNTSVCVYGLWYDSSRAEWEIMGNSHARCVIRNTWKNIPVSQLWTITTDNDNLIKWDVKMIVDTRIDIEESKASIILNSRYKKWIAGDDLGFFPREMSWNEVQIPGKAVKNIGVQSVKDKDWKFPSVQIIFLEKQEGVKPQLQNAGKKINARLLSVRKASEDGETIYLPGEHDIFSLQIKVME